MTFAPARALVPTSGLLDTFGRADGPVDGGWIDLADQLPNYAPALIKDGVLGIGTAEYSGSGLTITGLGQYGIYRSLGLVDPGGDDGVEVTVRQLRALDITDVDGTVSDIGWQVAACALIDPTADDPEKGLALYGDISLSGPGGHFIGLWGMFDADDFLAFDHYVLYDSTFIDQKPAGGLVLRTGQRSQLRLRVYGGKIAGYFNGQRVIGPLPIPAAFEGRDAWGANCIMAANPISDIGSIDTVELKPWSTDLGSYPSTPAVGTSGAASKVSAAAAIDLDYPTGIVAGERLMAIVATVSGNFVTPTPDGWQSEGTTQISLGVRVQVFTKTADGTETGTMTFERTGGTGPIGGRISRISGHNPVDAATGTNGQANSSASTALTAPSIPIQGLNRLVIFIGACGSNTAITVPAGFTEFLNLGTSGAALNVAAAWKSFSASPADVTGPLVGTLGASVASVGLTLHMLPDPR